MATTSGNTASASTSFASISAAALPLATSLVPAYSHIVVVVEENHGYSQIIGDTADAPYINNTLAAGGALLSNYTALSHPSEPNYFALYAGSTFGVTDDNFHSEPDPTLATILQGAGKSFVGYVESGNSDQNHNPWEYFPEGTSVEQPFSSFPTGNFASLPTVSFVIPTDDNNMHSGTIAQGDAWLQANINGYAQWATANNSLLVVVWDENDGSSGNQVAAILYGAHVVPGIYSQPYNHYDLLSTILAASNLTGPNNAATASPIAAFSASCFAAGTRIATAAGAMRVEDLRAGNHVVSAFGGTAPVVWVGYRRVDCARHPRPHDVWPVRVRAGAFGTLMPQRDLLLSPDHSVYVDGALVPIRYLVNGATISQECVDHITYFHVELPAHDVILAEGLPSESYLDTGNRAAFANGGTTVMLNPDFALEVWQTQACAPLTFSGERLARMRGALLERAADLGHVIGSDPDLHVIADNIVLPIASEGRTCRVHIPQAVQQLRLRSRTWTPAHTRIDGTDTRLLGVALSNVRLDGRSLADDDPRLSSGWHGPETGLRWTDGDAGLTPAGARVLEFDVAVTGLYWIQREHEQLRRA
ncbi:Hint domain-containing protein [Limobrevibacterium gyesilva]|uniref:Hint domain-containing protein n=1 Tax=Limobrevibacterium gyesilva TaxID=2991712 RepID=A0AA41YM12_9PROT|nr:Hint domain-containing protein [Limobrevibacterium gyesilva]MCW3474787.1 Hint domain-containing protein [Limobrevibacterium gyesilva]